MELTNEQKTGGENMASLEGGTLVDMEAFRQTDAVLLRIKRRRIKRDTADGFFRDYPDNATGPCWLMQLHVASTAMAEALDKRDESALRECLEAQAEVVVAWIEALDRRADERLQAKGYQLTWVQKLRRKLGLMP